MSAVSQGYRKHLLPRRILWPQLSKPSGVCLRHALTTSEYNTARGHRSWDRRKSIDLQCRISARDSQPRIYPRL